MSIPRAQLRPGYGAGCLGAPLTMVRPDDLPTERDGGGRHGTSSTENDPGAGGPRHVCTEPWRTRRCRAGV